MGTHNGFFHCDEVIAVAILSILMKHHGDINVVRSRDLEFLKRNTHWLVDIGSGEFDHHQKGGNGQRENEVKYASAGLIWKVVGQSIVGEIAGWEISNQEIADVVKQIDKNVIEKVDMEDNGQLDSSHPFQFIKFFLPGWDEEKTDFDGCFEKCVNYVSDILEQCVRKYVESKTASKQIELRLNDAEFHRGNVLILPCQSIPWDDQIIAYNEINERAVDFVVFPYPAGGYALQCVPPSKDDKYSQRISLPEEWAGETSQLPKISGIASATFCHNGRFFARAIELSDILKMCEVASQDKSYQAQIKK